MRANRWRVSKGGGSVSTRIRLAIFATALSLSILSSGGARAEGFFDVYLGGSFTDDETSRVSGFPPVSTQFDDSVIGGLRGGGWIRPWPWLGFAGEISYFRPDADSALGAADIHVIPISLLVMLRVPIFRSDDMPGGRLQPYVGVGPAVFISVIRVPDFFVGPEDFIGVDASIGLDVHAGVKVQILSWLAVFAEYRHTQFDANWDDDITGSNAKIKTELATDHFQLGVGFHF